MKPKIKTYGTTSRGFDSRVDKFNGETDQMVDLSTKGTTKVYERKGRSILKLVSYEPVEVDVHPSIESAIGFMQEVITSKINEA